MKQPKIIKPQEGYQELFLSSKADIVIGGGAAGVGKTFSLLLELVRNANVPNFTGVIFRKTTEQIRSGGGLWDTALELYNDVASCIDSKLSITFPSTCKYKFTYLQYEKDKYQHQGAQYAFIAFDELQHFTESQFLYMVSRNRTMTGVTPYMRCTCNPAPDTWLSRFIDWWIGDDGFPIPERDGVIRYFFKSSNNYIWGDTKEEVLSIMEKEDAMPDMSLLGDIDVRHLIKSVTFIGGNIYQNKALLSSNPEYLGSLMALDESDKAALLYGNWKYKIGDNSLFDKEAIEDISTPKQPYLPAKYNTSRFITCDVARMGSDKCCIFVWEGLKIIRGVIISRSDLNVVHETIQTLMNAYKISNKRVIVEQDGVGGGLVDMGRYIGVTINSRPLKSYNETANYTNLKTQMFYLLKRLLPYIYIDEDTFVVDGVTTNKLSVSASSKISISDCIKQELRAVKYLIRDGLKKAVTSKKEMKESLGRSPDLLDTLNLGMYFYLKLEKI